MKIAILGGGFTSLSVALKLLQKGHEVTILEKDSTVGGLAGGFKEEGWDWTLEKTYHHFFTNDKSALNLAQQINQPIITKRPKTDVFINGKCLPFDSPKSILSFPHLSFSSRLRTGFTAFYLKVSKNHKKFEGKNALPWVKKLMGKEVVDLIWEPLFLGKFGKFKDNISLTWFWARIKKRTSSLAYPEGGFQAFADKLALEIKKLGGKINLNTEVSSVDWTSLSVNKQTFDKIIVTLPTPVFLKLAPELPKDYIKKVSSIPHLHALNLILILKEPFLKDSYWLNITDTNFPFLVLAEHTNFMDSKHYGGDHILYIGNYLPENHPYLKLSAKELFQVYKPYLQQINPKCPIYDIRYTIYSFPYAQPVVTPEYPKLIPEFKTPLNNVYLANLDMVYPWDRGTNYAIEMGEKIAELITRDMG